MGEIHLPGLQADLTSQRCEMKQLPLKAAVGFAIYVSQKECDRRISIINEDDSCCYSITVEEEESFDLHIIHIAIYETGLSK